MNSLPPSTYEAIAQAHRVSARLYARMRASVAAVEGNPGQVALARFGSLWAARCDLPEAPQWMNLVTPLTVPDVAALPDVLHWYGELRPMLEVAPQPRHDELARELAIRGAVAVDHLDILRGPVAATAGNGPAGQEGVSVAVVDASPADAALFARTLLGGHVDEFREHEAAGIADLVGGDGLRCYLARVGGEPAAAAILRFDEGLAYLANASTLPAFRNRGCHNALLAARLRDAAASGCDTVIGLADVASISHRNMERAGLRTLVTVTQWRFPPGGS